MTPKEIVSVQDYLRHKLGNDRIAIDQPKKPGAPIEVRIGDEFVGVLYRDEEEGEVSYSLTLSILEEDLLLLEVSVASITTPLSKWPSALSTTERSS